MLRVSSHASYGLVQAQDTSGVVTNNQGAPYSVSKVDWVVDTWYNVKWFYEAGGRQKIKVWSDSEAEPAWLIDTPTTYAFAGDPTGFFVTVSRVNSETLYLTATLNDLSIEGIS